MIYLRYNKKSHIWHSATRTMSRDIMAVSSKAINSGLVSAHLVEKRSHDADWLQTFSDGIPCRRLMS